MNKPIPYDQVEIIERDAVKFGDPVFDSYISEAGGVELGTMIALSGTSGAGKTTLCKKWQKDLKIGEVSVFFALESSKASVAKQTKRIKTTNDELICDVKDYPKWSDFIKYLYEDKPTMVVVDSLQHAATLLSKENGIYKYDNYKTIIKDLYDWKDETQGIVILICQLNEKGKMEGPASTIFDVDCPIKLTADPKTGERYMETEKNRMGPIGKIFYEFVNTDACIKFYTVDEWEIMATGKTLEDVVNASVESFINAHSHHKNYKEFKKEFRKAYSKVIKESNTDIEVVVKIIPVLKTIADKHFS